MNHDTVPVETDRGVYMQTNEGFTLHQSDSQFESGFPYRCGRSYRHKQLIENNLKKDTDHDFFVCKMGELHT